METSEVATTSKPRRRRTRQTNGHAAHNEIDKRLAQAIVDRSDAIKKVNLLAYWQARLTALDQEINSLISYQQRLSGYSVTSQPVPTLPTSTGQPFSLNAPIPEGVGSIPARQPKPSGANVAESIGSEGGFE